MGYLLRKNLLAISCLLGLLFTVACDSTDSGDPSPLQDNWQSSFQMDTLTVDINLDLDSSDGDITGSGTVDGKVEKDEDGAMFTEEFTFQNTTTGSFNQPNVQLTLQNGNDIFTFNGQLSSDEQQIVGTAQLTVEGGDIVDDAEFDLVLQ